MAFGIVIVAHGKIGPCFQETVENILGPNPRLDSLELEWDIDFEDAKAALERKINKAKSKEGVLIFTDMFGGTPNNIALGFYSNPGVEIVSGINLPLLIKALTLPEETPVEKVGQLLKQEISKSIYVAGDLLG